MARYVYGLLTADTGAGGVSTLLGGRIYARRVPQGAALPAAIVQLVSAVPLNTMGGIRVAKNALVDVHLIAEGSDAAPLVDIADRVDLVLQGAGGSQDDAAVVELVCVNELEYDEDDAGKVYTHLIQSYRTAAYAVA